MPSSSIMALSSSAEVPGPRALPGARSYLFVPSNRPERIAKAWAAGPDTVIADLEDAVGPDAKDAAREALAGCLTAERPLIVRINAADTAWHEKDVDLCRLPGVAAVMLPKAETPDDIGALTARLGGELPLIALIETARGLWNAAAIAQTARVQRLAFGPLDFQVDLGLQCGEEELAAYRAQLVLASRVAGILPPVDGPTSAIDDLEVIRADALRARRTGFGGKLCIHPRQVQVVNECFSPNPAEVAWARRVVEAVGASGGAAATVDGKMVDRPVLIRAQRILEQCSQDPSSSPFPGNQT